MVLLSFTQVVIPTLRSIETFLISMFGGKIKIFVFIGRASMFSCDICTAPSSKREKMDSLMEYSMSCDLHLFLYNSNPL